LVTVTSIMSPQSATMAFSSQQQNNIELSQYLLGLETGR
jgi:hypothetical protein